MITDLDVDAIRSSLPVTERLVYLNTGTAGPLPQASIDAQAEAATREAEEGRIGHDGFQRLFDRLTELRAGLAAFLAAGPDEIAIAHNTTDGMNIGAWSLPWQRGDRVVTTTLEHPGGLLPLYLLHQRFGVEVDFAEIGRGGREETLEAMAKAIRPGTKLVMLSHVAWGTGAILPLREISELAHAAGALVLVDGAQSVGSIPVDMHAEGADFYAFSGQKWLCGPEGTGGIFVRADRLDRFTPTFVGGFGVKHDETYRPNDPKAFEFAPGAQRFEVGSLYRPGVYGLRASVEWRRALGDGTFTAIRDLAGYCLERVGELPGVEVLTPSQEPLSGLVAFRLAGVDVTKAVEELSAAGDRKSTRLNSSHHTTSRMPSSA